MKEQELLIVTAEVAYKAIHGGPLWHNGWNPAVFRECLVGKTQAVVVVVVAGPARCDWCLRPTVTVNTLC